MAYSILISIVFACSYVHFFIGSDNINKTLFTLDKVFSLHTSDIWSVKFSPDGNFLVSGSVDSTVRIWKREDGTYIRILKHPAGITYVAFSPDGNFLATASYDGKVRLWKFPEGFELKEFISHNGTVWSLDFSPDGMTLASCGDDAMIKLWDIHNGQRLKTLTGHALNVWDVKFSPDGRTIASGSFDKTVRIWKIADGKQLNVLNGHTEAIVALAYSPDGKILATTSDDKSIILWNTDSWSIMKKFEVAHHVQACDFSPDGKKLITGGRDQTIFGELIQSIFGESNVKRRESMWLWDIEKGNLLQTFSYHANDVNDVSFSPDGLWIASASSDKTAALWQLNEQK